MKEILVSFHQIWKHKFSNEKVKILAHIKDNIWECEYTAHKNRIQIADIELLENWKLTNERCKA